MQQEKQPRNITIVVSGPREAPGDAETNRLDDSLLVSLLAERFPNAGIVTTGHLYDLDPDGPALEHLRSVDGDLVVLSRLSGRASRWLLEAAEIKSGEEDQQDSRRIVCFDLRKCESAEDAVGEVGKELGPADDESSTAEAPVQIAEVTRERWYPIIDFERCVNCMECLDFCLFGVFDLDGDGRIAVLDADACRNGCPACARVCPNQAIMFPHHDNRAVAGDVDATPEDMGLNLVQLGGLGGPGQMLGGLGQMTGPEQLAAVEREKALAEIGKAAKKDRPAEKDELDKLVDELDEMDL